MSGSRSAYFNGIKFNNGGDKLKLLEISNWGTDFRLGNTGTYFLGCNNLTITATDILDLTGTTTLNGAFASCEVLDNIPSLSSWNISNITNVSFCFSDTLFNQDISSLDFSSVTNFTGLFERTPFNQDVSSMDTSSATSMSRMFSNATSFDEDLSSFDVTNVTNASLMLQNITLSTINYSNTLIGWEAQAVQNNVTFDGGNSQYSAGAAATARAALVADHTWTITDGGQEP